MTGIGPVLAAGASSVCRAWIVRRADGVVLGFTDHDVDLRVDGVPCHASSGMTAGAFEVGSGLSVDNGEAMGALSSDGIVAEDIHAGRWDGADVVAYLVDWSEPARFEMTFRGSLGEITEGGGRFTAELRGLADALNVPRGRVFHSRCDAVLGDARCAVDLGAAALSFEAIVAAVLDEGRTLRFNAADVTAQAGWFAWGRCAWLSGAATGLDARVRSDASHDGGRDVSLWDTPRAAIAAGDRVRLEAGCDKTAGTCRTKFANFVNFRGFPHLPGDDWLVASPAAGGAG